MARVIVTGGAGFIGSNLVDRLTEDDVYVVDNLHTGTESNLVGMGARMFQADVKSIDILHLKDPDIIYHLGMYSSSPMYLEDKSLIGEVLAGATAIFDYAVENDVKVVFASSSSLYNGHKPPHRETMVPFVKDFYTEARYGVERLARLYHDLYGMRYAAMRFFSVYGPREEHKGKYANLLTQFIWSVKKGQNPVMRGDGSAKRDFIHVDDVVAALILAGEVNKNGIFNVGGGGSHSLNEVVDEVSNYAGWHVKATHLPEKGVFEVAPGMPEIGKNYVKETRADTAKSAEQLHFRASISLAEGVAMMMGR